MARKIRNRAWWLRPVAPPSEIAAALGIQVLVKHNLGPGVRGCCDPFISAIYVAPMPYRARVEWTVAHELAEREVRRAIPDGDEHERYCQAVAAALMMPALEFRRSGWACGWDLETLRSWWPHCSCAALLRRAAELEPSTATAIWDNSMAKLRERYPGVDRPEEVDELEEFIACEAMHAESGRSEIVLGGVQVKAWRTGEQHAAVLSRRLA